MRNKYRIKMILFIALALAIIVAGIFLMKPTITGKITVIKEANYTETKALEFSQSSEYALNLTNKGQLKSLKISGTVAKNGYAKVYLLKGSEKYLVFDSTITEGITGITGLVIGNETPQENITPENKTINLNLEYKTGTNYDANDDGIETLTGIVDLTVENSVFNFNAVDNKLCTKYEIFSLENNLSSIICYGDNDCCAYIGLLPSSANWNDALNIYYRFYNASLNNEIYAKIIHYKTNEIIESDIEKIDVKFREEFIEFNDVCVDTCLLNLNEISYTLLVELNDSKINIDQISYSLSEEVNISNRAPLLLKNISDVSIEINKNITIDLTQYFMDEDNDVLNYNFYQQDNLIFNMNNNILTIIPDKNFTGTRYSFITANDSKLTAVSNVFMVNVSGIYENITINATPENITKEEKKAGNIRRVHNKVNVSEKSDDEFMVNDYVFKVEGLPDNNKKIKLKHIKSEDYKKEFWIEFKDLSNNDVNVNKDINITFSEDCETIGQPYIDCGSFILDFTKAVNEQGLKIEPLIIYNKSIPFPKQGWAEYGHKLIIYNVTNLIDPWVFSSPYCQITASAGFCDSTVPCDLYKNVSQDGTCGCRKLAEKTYECYDALQFKTNVYSYCEGYTIIWNGSITGERLLDMQSQTGRAHNYRDGVLVNAGAYATTKGCTHIINTSSTGTSPSFAYIAPLATAQFYGTKIFFANDYVNTTYMNSLVTKYNLDMDGGTLSALTDTSTDGQIHHVSIRNPKSGTAAIGRTGTMDYKYITITNAGIGVIQTGTYGIFAEASIYNSTVNWQGDAASGYIIFADVNSDNISKVNWTGTGATGNNILKISYSLKVKVLDTNGNPINATNITIKDKNGAVINYYDVLLDFLPYSLLSNETGEVNALSTRSDSLSRPYIFTGNYTYATGTNFNNDFPFTLTATKKGYLTYTQQWNHTKAENWVITLKPGAEGTVGVGQGYVSVLGKKCTLGKLCSSIALLAWQNGSVSTAGSCFTNITYQNFTTYASGAASHIANGLYNFSFNAPSQDNVDNVLVEIWNCTNPEAKAIGEMVVEHASANMSQMQQYIINNITIVNNNIVSVNDTIKTICESAPTSELCLMLKQINTTTNITGSQVGSFTAGIADVNNTIKNICELAPGSRMCQWLNQTNITTQLILTNTTNIFVLLNSHNTSVITKLDTITTDLKNHNTTIYSYLTTTNQSYTAFFNNIQNNQTLWFPALSNNQTYWFPIFNTYLNTINTTQKSEFKIVFSNYPAITAGSNYQGRIYVFDYLGRRINASSLPNITIYNPLHEYVASGIMNYVDDGIYNYSYTTSALSTSGIYETIVWVNFSNNLVQANDYWSIASSPADAVIDYMEDTTYPGVSARTIITNMGTIDSDFEYVYCIVETSDNKCGGGDDIDYASGTRYIVAGSSWTSTLGLTVPSVAANYYFKLKAKALGETIWAGASKQFTAITGAAAPTLEAAAGAGGGGAGGAARPRIDFMVTPDIITTSLLQEEGKSFDLQIKNTGNKRASIKIDIEGIGEIASISKKEFNLDVGEIKLVKLNLFASSKITPGIYVGRILIKADSIEKAVNAVIEVKELKPSFSIKLSILPEYKKVEAGDRLSAMVYIENINQEELENSVLRLSIMDTERKTLFESSEEKLNAKTKTSMMKEFKIPSSLPSGEYVLIASIIYKNTVTDAYDNFEVLEKKGVKEMAMLAPLKEVPIYIWLIILVLVILIALIFIVFVLYRKIKELESGGRAKLHKHNEPEKLKRQYSILHKKIQLVDYLERLDKAYKHGVIDHKGYLDTRDNVIRKINELGKHK